MGFLSALLLTLTVGVAAWIFLPAVWVIPALHRGDYDTAIRRAHWCRWCAAAPLLRASVLIYADRLREAEEILRPLVARGKYGHHTLACAMLYANRLDEARQLIEEAIRREPRQEAYRGTLAQILLRGGQRSPEVLEHAEAALRSIGCGPVASRLNPNARAEYHALRAWARAATGDGAGAEQDEQGALARCASSIPYAAGEVGWMLGNARRELGDAPAAQRHFERAHAADPKGTMGRLSAEALAG